MNSVANLRLFPLCLIIYITDGFIHITLFLTNDQGNPTLFLTNNQEKFFISIRKQKYNKSNSEPAALKL